MWLRFKGDAEAQLRLGLMYAEGKGVLKKNKVEAAQWYGKAAEQGHTMAQTVLAGAYEDGLGVQRDYVRAAKWYQEAAEQGAAHAQYKLGCMYAEGKGVLTNEVEAVKWYRIAAGQDNAWAQRALGHAYEYGLGVPQDLAQAVEWYQKAAEERIGRPGEGLGGKTIWNVCSNIQVVLLLWVGNLALGPERERKPEGFLVVHKRTKLLPSQYGPIWDR